jgi:hypothetical protein
MNYPVNFLSILVSSIIPLIIGMLWYNPKVFGTIWMKASAMKAEDAKPVNMVLVFGLLWLFSLMISVILGTMVVHQTGVFGVMAGEAGFLSDPKAASTIFYNEFIADYGDRFRSPQHGALHGGMAGLFFALPIIGVNVLFERRSFTYVAVHTGYWVLSLTIMGAIICAWQ